MFHKIFQYIQTYAGDPIVNPEGANTFCELNDVFSNIIKAAVPIAGIALFVMLVWGGFRYLTSGGDPKGTEQAKGTLTFAIAGIIMMILAWFILVFIHEFTGVNVTQFEIPC